MLVVPQQQFVQPFFTKYLQLFASSHVIFCRFPRLDIVFFLKSGGRYGVPLTCRVFPIIGMVLNYIQPQHCGYVELYEHFSSPAQIRPFLKVYAYSKIANNLKQTGALSKHISVPLSALLSYRFNFLVYTQNEIYPGTQYYLCVKLSFT